MKNTKHLLASSILVTLLLAACATPTSESGNASSETATNAAAAPAAQNTTPNATTAPETVAAKDPILIGKTYHQAHTPPLSIEKDWKRLLSMDLGAKSSDAFMLLTDGDRKLAIAATKGQHLHGVTYEYTISDEMLLPESIKDYSIARCSQKANGHHSVLAAFAANAPHTPVWAISISESGKIEALLDAELAALRCNEKPKPL